MKKTKLNASSIKMLLITLLVILGVFTIGGFYYAQDWLGKFATDIVNSQASTNTKINPNDLSKTQAELQKDQVYFNKAASITASQKDYNSQIQQDLNKYASETGVKIAGFGPASIPTTSQPIASVNGVKSVYLLVTVQNPVSYDSLIKFVSAVETNLPKIKLTGISIKRVDNLNDNVSVEPLIIEVYVR